MTKPKADEIASGLTPDNLLATAAILYLSDQKSRAAFLKAAKGAFEKYAEFYK